MKKGVMSLTIITVWLQLFVCTAASQIKIMPIGDSITQGGFNSNASYRVALYNLLTANSVDFKFVGSVTTVYSESSTNPSPTIYPNYRDTSFSRNHEGHSGWTTAQIVSSSDVTNSISSNQPDVAIIHLGTNDLGKQLISSSNNYASAITNLTTTINRLRAANANVKIVLAQIVPYKSTAYSNTSYTQVAGYNAKIAELASSLSTTASPVMVVDQYTGFDVSADHTADGLHPNQYGEQKMADRFYMAVQTLLNPNTRIHCPLNVNNASFEDGTPTTDNSANSTFTCKGWVLNKLTDSACRFWNPGSASYSGAAASGTASGADGSGVILFYNQNALTEGNLSSISQTIGGYLQSHMEYALTVAVGNRYSTLFAGARIELLVGDTIIGSLILDSDSEIPDGQFTDVTLTINSDTLDQTLLGEFMTIRLSPYSTLANVAVDFDNVRLTSADIPEPASLLFLTFGSLLAFRRR